MVLKRDSNVLKEEHKLPVDVRGSKTSVLKLSYPGTTTQFRTTFEGAYIRGLFGSFDSAVVYSMVSPRPYISCGLFGLFGSFGSAVDKRTFIHKSIN